MSGPKTERPAALPFSAAKTALSSVVDRAVHGHTPVKIERHGGKESVLVVNADDLASALSGEYAKSLAAEVLVEAGGYAAVVEALGLQGTGASMDEAVEDLLAALREYARRYFANLEFYRRTPNRADHYLPLLLFRACDDHRQRSLVEGESLEVAALA